MTDNTSNRVWDMLMKIAVPLSILAAGALVNHEMRISQINASYFSRQQGIELERRMMTSFPQQWLKDDINEIKTMLRSYDERLRNLESKKE